MIKDPQEYLQEWEKQNNPFYPFEMKWDRVKVNHFLKDWKEQCNIDNVVGRSEQLKAFAKSLQYKGVRILTDEGVEQAVKDFKSL